MANRVAYVASPGPCLMRYGAQLPIVISVEDWERLDVVTRHLVNICRAVENQLVDGVFLGWSYRVMSVLLCG